VHSFVPVLRVRSSPSTDRSVAELLGEARRTGPQSPGTLPGSCQVWYGRSPRVLVGPIVPGMEVAFLLALAGIAFVLLMPLVLLAVRVRRLVRRRGLTVSAALLTSGSLIAIVLIALVYAGVTYGWGVLSGFAALDAGEMCASAAGFYSGTPGPSDEMWTGIAGRGFPIERTCVWSDGTRFELVPWWVNPLLFSWLAIAAGALPAGLAARAVDRGEAARNATAL